MSNCADLGEILETVKVIAEGDVQSWYTAWKATADRVLALNVLHEVGDEALRAMVALLKPGGTVLVVDWNAGVERPVGPPRDHVYTAAEARERMERMGLRIDGERMFKYHYSFVARAA